MRGILFSIFLHTLVVLAVALGLPWLTKPPANASRNITVDIVRLSDITQASKGQKPKPKTVRKPDAERETTKKPVARDRRAETPPDPPKPDEPKPVESKSVKSKSPAPEPPKAAKPKPAPPAKAEVAKPVTAPPARPKPVQKAKTAPKPKVEPPRRVEIDPRALQRQAEKPKKKLPAKKPETRVAKPAPKAKPKPEPKAKPKPAKVPEPRVAKAPAKPEKKKAPANKPEAPVVKPRKKPAPKPLETAKKAAPKVERQIAALPRPRPALKPRPKNAAKKPRKTVKKRPAKENPLDSVFKTVGKLKKTAEQSDRERTAARTRTGVETAARSLPMTLSEIEAIRRQIQPCWNFPAGAQDAGSLRVLIRIRLNRDGSVLGEPKVLDQNRFAGDHRFRAAAEAGIRAVKNPRCSPLRLPQEKFDQWKVLTIDFDPSKLNPG